MKKLIAIAGALALVGCGDSADEPAEAEIDDTVIESTLPATTAGTYTSTTPEGTEVAVSLNADGTYSVVQDGETVESGTWEDTDRGTCLVAEGGDGEDCWTIRPGTEAGMMDITGADGETHSYSFKG